MKYQTCHFLFHRERGFHWSYKLAPRIVCLYMHRVWCTHKASNQDSVAQLCSVFVRNNCEFLSSDTPINFHRVAPNKSYHTPLHFIWLRHTLCVFVCDLVSVYTLHELTDWMEDQTFLFAVIHPPGSFCCEELDVLFYLENTTLRVFNHLSLQLKWELMYMFCSIARDHIEVKTEMRNQPQSKNTGCWIVSNDGSF